MAQGGDAIAVDGTLQGSWTAATTNLFGLASDCGNLGYVSSKPDQDMLIAGVALQGLWASANGATDWSSLGQGDGGPQPITNRTSQIIYDPDPSHAGTFWQAGAYGPCAYQTADDGATFVQLGSANHCDSISVDFTDPARQTILAGGHESHRLWRSADGGKTWVDLGPSVPATAGNTGFVLALGAQIHLVATWSAGNASGIFRSTDGGSTWAPVFSGGIRSRPLVASNGAIYWVLNDAEGASGLIASTDQGATWTKVGGQGVIVSTEQGLVELPDGRFVTRGSTNLVISPDHGANWRALGPVLPYAPWGVAYSPFRKSFYIWHFDCNMGGNPVSADAIMRFPFDYTSQ